jgi:hypothetical protein
MVWWSSWSSEVKSGSHHAAATNLTAKLYTLTFSLPAYHITDSGIDTQDSTRDTQGSTRDTLGSLEDTQVPDDSFL